MTTSHPVSTIEDIIGILREQPEVREAVRREILPVCQLEMNGNLLQMDYILQDMVVLQWKPPTDPDTGFITYWMARKAAERRYGGIAFDMGLEPRRLLDYGDVFRLTMHEAAGHYDDTQIARFIDCMVIVADSPSEGKCYVVTEVWGTTCQADVDQAVENARMATHFTGRPAYPAVAAFRRADVPRSYFASNGVHWHRLPQHR